MVYERLGVKGTKHKLRVPVAITGVCGVSLTLAALTGVGDVEQSAVHVQTVLDEYQDRSVEIVNPTVDYNNQLLLSDNPRLQSTATSPSDVLGFQSLQPRVAYSVTHAGFLDKQLIDAHSYLDGLRGVELIEEYQKEESFFDYYAHFAEHQEGQIADYGKRMKELIGSLATSQSPSLFNLEEDTLTGYWDGGMPADLQPPANSFIAITKPATGELKPIVTMATHKKGLYVKSPQEPKVYYDWLKNQGITEIHVAGEFVYNSDQTLACLGITALQLLDEGFRVRGIKGLVYPLTPPAHSDGTPDFKRVIDSVYGDSVTAPNNNNDSVTISPSTPHNPLSVSGFNKNTLLAGSFVERLLDYPGDTSKLPKCGTSIADLKGVVPCTSPDSYEIESW